MIKPVSKYVEKIFNLDYDDIKDENLGGIYTKEKTIFRVFAPFVESVYLLITDDFRKARKDKHPMEKNDLGIWEVTLKGDYEGWFYTYLVDEKYEVTDPYSFSSSINSLASVVIDMEKTNPLGFAESAYPDNKEENAIIYELNVKDYTADEKSGVNFRGKFLGLSEENTSYKGVSTGLSNIKDLGISHVQILPIYDFISVDEDDEKFFDDDNYNWGYDPELYFAPEGSYSIDPTNPKSRVRELKEMVNAFHKNNISVIMDVVYNHTFKSYDSNLNTLAGSYYHRMNEDGTFSNGSGVGNELASERAFVRKLIIDSLTHWVKEYKIDGFRFDLMALIDIDTIELALEKLKKINPNLIIYGEPWMAFNSPLPLEKQILKGSQRSKGFAVFNDNFRDAIKGDVNGYGKGYIQGIFNNKLEVELGIAGSIAYDEKRIGFADHASETINYFNCHDNLILYDKLAISLNQTTNIDDYIKMALAILFLSFGKPFIYEGNEFNHSKNNDANSYRSPLTNNGIKWQDKVDNIEIFNYLRDLIKLRKSIKPLSLTKAEDIRKSLRFMDKLDPSLIIYEIIEGNKSYLITINAANKKDAISSDSIRGFLGEGREKITKIFSKKGINKERVDLSQGLILDKKSVEVYRIGE
ncbi:MAG: type I pullulanase [Anaerococcus sp.]|nr:type I pullulanase [Anaerococcus sp.]